MNKTRRRFIRYIALTTTTLGFFPLSVNSNNSKAPEKELVFEFVKAGHNDLNKTKQLLKEDPLLIYSSWDWGRGDFETALGGAGHVGNVEIAEFLISQGARANLFSFTMLGKTNLVIPALKEYPQLIYSSGPHGFSLLHHANIGGENALEIKKFLTSAGLKERKFDLHR